MSRKSTASAGAVGGEANKRDAATSVASRRLVVNKRPAGTRETTRRSLSMFKNLAKPGEPGGDSSESLSVSDSYDSERDMEYNVEQDHRKSSSSKTSSSDSDASLSASSEESQRPSSANRTSASFSAKPATKPPSTKAVWEFKSNESPVLKKPADSKRSAVKASIVSVSNNSRGTATGSMQQQRGSQNEEPPTKKSKLSQRDEEDENNSSESGDGKREPRSIEASKSAVAKLPAKTSTTKKPNAREKPGAEPVIDSGPLARHVKRKGPLTMFDVALDRVSQLMDMQLQQESNDPLTTAAYHRLHSALSSHFGDEAQLASASKFLSANLSKLRSELKARRTELLKLKKTRLELGQQIARHEGSIENLADQTVLKDQLSGWLESIQSLTEAAERLKKDKGTTMNTVSSNGVNLAAILASIKQHQHSVEHVRSVNESLQKCLKIWDGITQTRAEYLES